MPIANLYLLITKPKSTYNEFTYIYNLSMDTSLHTYIFITSPEPS